jgi:hypothetical protein
MGSFDYDVMIIGSGFRGEARLRSAPPRRATGLG